MEGQYQLGSCVGNAVANAYELMILKQYPQAFTNLSRLFIYYNARLLVGYENEDAGAYLGSAMSALKKYGVCQEESWPYLPEKFNIKPTAECYTEALPRAIPEYRRIEDLVGIVEVLNTDTPVVFGMILYQDFMRLDKNHAIVQMPASAEIDIGAHAMSMVGYDADQRLFLAKNSFGTDWGDSGYCWIPFEYVEKYQTEMWWFSIPKLA